MKMFRNQNYYEILEIRPDASYKEIEEAYRRAKETYSGGSLLPPIPFYAGGV